MTGRKSGVTKGTHEQQRTKMMEDPDIITPKPIVASSRPTRNAIQKPPLGGLFQYFFAVFRGCRARPKTTTKVTAVIGMTNHSIALLKAGRMAFPVADRIR